MIDDSAQEKDKKRMEQNKKKGLFHSMMNPNKTHHEEKHHNVHMQTSIDFKHMFRGRKLPVVTLDERWLNFFGEEDMTQEMKTLRDQVNHLMMKQGKTVEDIKGYKRYKSQLMQEIVDNMETDDTPIGKLRQKKMEKNQKLIQEINDSLVQNEDELADLPFMIKETNEALMAESAYVLYQRMAQGQKLIRERKQRIEEIKVELKQLEKEQVIQEKENRDIYLYMHDMLGTEVMKQIDAEQHWD